MMEIVERHSERRRREHAENYDIDVWVSFH